MPIRLAEIPGPFRQGTISDRPNRFILEVRFDDGSESDVYISNTGSWNVTKSGRAILAKEIDAADRKTDFDAVFVETDGVWVSVDSTFPNTAFETAVSRELLPEFEGYEIRKSEPSLPSGGRADFRMQTPAGNEALVEVKSCTLVDDDVATFPDRPTKRGRRHLEELIELTEDGTETHVVFVIQREDGERFTPNAEVDPEFAHLLAEAADAGVGIHAMQLAIDPPEISLENPAMPIDLPAGRD